MFSTVWVVMGSISSFSAVDRYFEVGTIGNKRLHTVFKISNSSSTKSIATN